MDKKQIVHKVVSCAKKYSDNIAGKRFLVIGIKGSNLISDEVLFLKQHFMHLTGVTYKKGSAKFVDDCLNFRISADDILVRDDGTTAQKLSVLSSMIDFCNQSSMYGSFDNKNLYLKPDTVLGTEKWFLGFVNDSKSNCLVPNTLMNADVRKFSSNVYAVRLILERAIDEKVYKKIAYEHKDFAPSTLRKLPRNVLDKIDIATKQSSAIKKDNGMER